MNYPIPSIRLLYHAIGTPTPLYHPKMMHVSLQEMKTSETGHQQLVSERKMH
jgi:hypothetical protein